MKIIGLDLASGEDFTAYRGVRLPRGMSPELADELEHKLCAWYDEQDQFPLEFGIELFKTIAAFTSPK
jgi:hypothetical protein